MCVTLSSPLYLGPTVDMGPYPVLNFMLGGSVRDSNGIAIYQRGTILGDGLQVAGGVMTLGTVNTMGPGGFGLRAPDYFEVQFTGPVFPNHGPLKYVQGGLQLTGTRYGDTYVGWTGAWTRDRGIGVSGTAGWLLSGPDVPFGVQPNRQQLNSFLAGQSDQFVYGTRVYGVPVAGGATWNSSGVALNLGTGSPGPNLSHGENPNEPSPWDPKW